MVAEQILAMCRQLAHRHRQGNTDPMAEPEPVPRLPWNGQGGNGPGWEWARVGLGQGVNDQGGIGQGGTGPECE